MAWRPRRMGQAGTHERTLAPALHHDRKHYFCARVEWKALPWDMAGG